MNQTDLRKLLLELEFNPQAPAPVEQVVFRIQFKTIGSLGDFMIFSGRQKAGKSKYVSGAIAAGISRQDVFSMSIKLPEGKNRIAHFDTEQGKTDHYRMMQLIKELAGLDQLPDRFKSYRCRQLEGRHILSLVETYLQLNQDCGMVFLDGLLDTIQSMNDERHSSFLKDWLKRITEQYNILLAGVIHRGFANDKSIGQIGSATDRAAQSVLKIEKNKETKQYVMTSEYLRSADDIDPIAIMYNNQTQTWEETMYIDEATAGPVKTKNDKRRPYQLDTTELQTLVVRIFNSQTVLMYKQLIEIIKAETGTGQQWAKDCIPVLLKENLMWRVGTDEYTNIRQGKLLKVE